MSLCRARAATPLLPPSLLQVIMHACSKDLLLLSSCHAKDCCTRQEAEQEQHSEGQCGRGLVGAGDGGWERAG